MRISTQILALVTNLGGLFSYRVANMRAVRFVTETLMLGEPLDIEAGHTLKPLYPLDGRQVVFGELSTKSVYVPINGINCSRAATDNLSLNWHYKLQAQPIHSNNLT